MGLGTVAPLRLRRLAPNLREDFPSSVDIAWRAWANLGVHLDQQCRCVSCFLEESSASREFGLLDGRGFLSLWMWTRVGEKDFVAKREGPGKSLKVGLPSLDCSIRTITVEQLRHLNPIRFVFPSCLSTCGPSVAQTETAQSGTVLAVTPNLAFGPCIIELDQLSRTTMVRAL